MVHNLEAMSLQNTVIKKGIKLTHTPPYHPASNGLAERNVQTVKTVLKKLVYDCEKSGNSFNLETSISEFLRKQRNIPGANGETPAQKVLSYRPKWEMEELKSRNGNENFVLKSAIKHNMPKRAKKVRFEEKPQKSENKKVISLKKGEKIWYLSHQNGKIYRYEGEVVKQITKHLYEIEIEKSRKVAHVNQIQKKFVRRSHEFDEPVIEKKRLEKENSFDKGTFAEVIAFQMGRRRSQIEQSSKTSHKIPIRGKLDENRKSI